MLNPAPVEVTDGRNASARNGACKLASVRLPGMAALVLALAGDVSAINQGRL